MWLSNPLTLVTSKNRTRCDVWSTRLAAGGTASTGLQRKGGQPGRDARVLESAPQAKRRTNDVAPVSGPVPESGTSAQCCAYVPPRLRCSQRILWMRVTGLPHCIRTATELTWHFTAALHVCGSTSMPGQLAPLSMRPAWDFTFQMRPKGGGGQAGSRYTASEGNEDNGQPHE